MKNIVPLTITSVAVCLLTGCETTGISPREHSRVEYPNYILSMSAGQPGAPSKKAALPVRLAVAQIGEVAPPGSMLDNLAKRKDLITSVIGLPLPGDAQTAYDSRKSESAFNYAGKIQSVCELAKASGADYIFLFGGNVDSWTKGNALRIFDFTIVGGMILPATEINTEGKGAGTLIDVATRQPVFFINVDDHESRHCPDFYSNEDTTPLCVQSRNELVRKLQDGLLQKLADNAAP